MKTFRLYQIFLLSIAVFVLATLLANSQSVLVYPANNDDCIPRDTVAFRWSVDKTAGFYYRVTVSEFADLSLPIYDNYGTKDTTAKFYLSKNGITYHWQVESLSQASPPSAPTTHYSINGSFKTIKSPLTMSLPTNNYICAPKICQFQWQSILGATYTLQVSTDNLFSSFLLNQSNISNNSYTYELPAYNSTYYWRVKANYSTCVTDFPTPYKFTTQVPPTSLGTPANGANSQSTIGLRFKWAAIQGASTYTVQISTDTSFSAGSIFYEAIKKTNTDSVVNFNPSTTYYWRVDADQSGCPVPWTSPYSFITGYTPPQNPKSKIDSCDPTKIALSWDNVSGTASYRLQVSVKPDFTTLLTDSQNLSTNYIVYIIQKPNQRYYWRVKASDGVNSGDWSTVGNFINNGGSPDRSIPANNSFNQPDTVLFKWVKPDINSQERIQIALDTAFNPVLFDIKNIYDDSVYVIMPNYNTKYYWKILTDYSCTVVWSNPWAFTTTLDKPQLVFPADSSTKQSQSITFQWLPTDGATTYEFSLSTDPLFQTQYIVKGIKGYQGVTMRVQNLLVNTNYFWKVKAYNGTIAVSAWSDIHRFRTGAEAPAIPNLVAPTNGKQNLVVTKVNLTWDAVPNAKYYWIQISTKNDFSTKVKDVPDLTDSQFDLTGLVYNTTYYWRVLAISDSSQSDWSPVWSFITAIQFPTDVAKLSSPANKTEVNTSNITFNWSSVARADDYDFQLATDDRFTTGQLVVDDSLVLTNLRFVTGLQTLSQYFWRVRGKNASGHAGWSETWNFTTLITDVADNPETKYHINISPNPVTGLSFLTLNLPNESNVKIEVINILGLKIDELVNNNLPVGGYSYIINSSKYENGVYYLVFTIDGITVTKKMIVLK